MESAVIIWNISKGQVGYLDFSYRIQALCKKYKIYIVVNENIKALSEFDGLDFQQILIAHKSDSKIDLLKYLKSCHSIIHDISPITVFLMGTISSILAPFIKEKQKIIYWNEHPLHISPKSSNYFKNKYRSFFRALIYWSASKADLCMAISPMMEQDLIDHGCNNTVVIDMGVSNYFKQISDGRTKRINNDIKKIVYTGTVAAYRGRDLYLEAIKSVVAKGYRLQLTIVGADDAQLEFCSKYIFDNQLGDYIKVHKRVPPEDLGKFLAQADYGLCLWENLEHWKYNPPTKLFEYLAAGLPVLASNIETHTNYIDDGLNGFIFEYSVDGLSNLFMKITTPNIDYQMLSVSALNKGEKYYWESIEPKFLSYFISTPN